jgi:hypothetical protein
MRLGDRVKQLSQTVQQTTEWATRLEKDGISLRFLNNTGDESKEFSNITQPEKVGGLIRGINPRGPTKLGTVLRKKVVQPLADKAMKTEGRVKPRIIMIVTDGEVRNPSPLTQNHEVM